VYNFFQIKIFQLRWFGHECKMSQKKETPVPHNTEQNRNFIFVTKEAQFNGSLRKMQ